MALNRGKLSILRVIIFLTWIFGLFFPAFWADYTLDFTLPSDYTATPTNEAYVIGSLAQLKQQLSHTGVISNWGSVLLNTPDEVIVDGNYAYVSSFWSSAIEILNISNPASPSHVSSISDNWGSIRLNSPAGMVKDGNYLYVAAYGSDAMQVIDVSTPASPSAVWQVLNSPTSRRLNGARGITKSGNYLYIACDIDDSLVVIDVTTPTAPSYVATLRNTTHLNGARAVKVSGNYAYVTAYDGGRFAVVDITTPSAPTIVTSIRNNGTTRKLSGAWGLEIDGNYAYVTSYLGNALQVIDITTPATPLAVTNVTTAWGSYQLNGARDIQYDNGYLYVAAYGSDAINIIDVQSPSVPTFVNSIAHNAANPLLDGAIWLFKTWNYVYVASSVSNALEALYISYPTSDPYVENNTSISFVWGIFRLDESFWANHTGTVKYQISKNGGSTWYYYNGSAWTVAWSASYSLASTASTINTNLAAFKSVGSGTSFKVRAFLHSTWQQKVELDTLTLNTDSAAPTINAFAPVDDSVLPIGNFNIIFDHTDSESGIDVASSTLTLQKWNGASYGADIAGTYVNFWTSVINTTSAVFPVSWLPYGKYKWVYSIEDTFWNIASQDIFFYVDQIEFTINQPSVNIGNLETGVTLFSTDEIIVTVKTVGVGFNVKMRQTSNMTTGLDDIPNWNGVLWFWYDAFPYTSNISTIANPTTIATQAKSINTNGDKNTYTYKLKYGSLIQDPLQVWWDYSANLAFDISLDYVEIWVCTMDSTEFGCSMQ